MQELIGLKVKITLNSVSGFITLNGRVVNVFDSFILIETTLGPQYVAFHAIKTILVIGETI